MGGVVGKTGFEPATPWSQTRCATGLRHFPILFTEAKAKVKLFLLFRPTFAKASVGKSGEGGIRTLGTV
jgi:hypothetical protein